MTMAVDAKQIRQTVWPASGSCGRTVVPERPFSRGSVGRPDSLSYLKEQGDGMSQLVNIQSRVNRSEIAGGLLYCHSRLNSNTTKLLESASFLYALIEVLEDKGLVNIDELEEKKREVATRLLDSFLDRGMGVAMQEDERDKYTFSETVEIDCASRVHLCKAACCRMSFALSQQDVEEGVVKWDLGRPYLIAQDAMVIAALRSRNELLHGARSETTALSWL